ncbi:ABC transporter substrate-binding protein [Alicyclobacillus shizuokensis]|uniref:ABC transporter substrate-binding protein n=1 Tax=Alicyclobacillus shizuokensis TaxID=392014 RepID=UPI0009FAC368|nr:sugar ABC transporter substrate-binding protein [Alicyclobacillus shizuokensis]
MKRKWGSAFVVSMAAACLVSACGQGNNSGTDNAAGGASKEKVTIRFTWWGDPVRNKVYNGVISQFEKKYPNIDVKAEPTSWADYWTKLSTQIAGGNAPDVIGMHQFYVSDYAERGALLNLEPYVKSGVINLKDFPQAVTDSGKVNGSLDMIAQGVTMSGQIYNETLFKQLGVQPPTMNWTWDDFINEATAVKKAFIAKGEGKDHWGADDESGAMEPVFEYFLRERGKDLFTTDGKLGFTKQDLEDWFAMWAKLRKDGVVPDAATEAQYTGVAPEQTLFAKGKVGITAIPANQLYLYQTAMPDAKVRLVGEPRMKNGRNGEFVEGAYLAIPKSSQHPKEAAEFINFFINDVGAGKIFKLEQGSPGSTKIDSVIKPLLSPPQQSEMDFISNRLKLASTAPKPPKGYNQIAADFTNAAQAVAYGKVSISQGAQQFFEQVNSLLGQ